MFPTRLRTGIRRTPSRTWSTGVPGSLSEAQRREAEIFSSREVRISYVLCTRVQRHAVDSGSHPGAPSTPRPEGPPGCCGGRRAGVPEPSDSQWHGRRPPLNAEADVLELESDPEFPPCLEHDAEVCCVAQNDKLQIEAQTMDTCHGRQFDSV